MHGLGVGAGPGRSGVGGGLEIFSSFIDFGIFLVGVHCFPLSVGVNNYWVTSDISLRRNSSHKHWKPFGYKAIDLWLRVLDLSLGR